MQRLKQPSPLRLAAPKERLTYIADMLDELERMASEAGEQALADLLRLAASEAKEAARLKS